MSTFTSENVLLKLGLGEYAPRFIAEGFERWDVLMDATESDFAALDVKRGHRRIIQREIASCLGFSPGARLDLVLGNGTISALRESPEESQQSLGKYSSQTSPISTVSAKRRYRRHPRPDENSPPKPPSAYVMFASQIREELKGQNLTFTELAKIVGDRWKTIDSREKEKLGADAMALKEKYLHDLNDYKKTNEYREYQVYLSEFKSKSSSQEEDVKRLKMEPIPARHTEEKRASYGSSSGADSPGLRRPSRTSVGASPTPFNTLERYSMSSQHSREDSSSFSRSSFFASPALPTQQSGISSISSVSSVASAGVEEGRPRHYLPAPTNYFDPRAPQQTSPVLAQQSRNYKPLWSSQAREETGFSPPIQSPSAPSQAAIPSHMYPPPTPGASNAASGPDLSPRSLSRS